MTHAWAERGQSGRPGRGLSLDRIVNATLDLIDDQGIGAATTRAWITNAVSQTVSEVATRTGHVITATAAGPSDDYIAVEPALRGSTAREVRSALLPGRDAPGVDVGSA